VAAFARTWMAGGEDSPRRHGGHGGHGGGDGFSRLEAQKAQEGGGEETTAFSQMNTDGLEAGGSDNAAAEDEAHDADHNHEQVKVAAGVTT